MAFLVVAVFLPQQVAQAVEYDWRILWQKPPVYSPAGLAGNLNNLRQIDIPLTVRNILKDISGKPITAVRISPELTIELEKPLDISPRRIEEIYNWLQGKPCGSKALYDFLTYKGVKVEEQDVAVFALTIDILNDVVKPEGNPKVIKNSLYALAKASEFFGHKLYPVSLRAPIQLSSLRAPEGRSNLSNSITPFIAHLNGDHYILVTRITEEKVYYIDEHKEEFLPQEKFLKDFSGYALITSSLRGVAEAISDTEAKVILGAKRQFDGYPDLEYLFKEPSTKDLLTSAAISIGIMAAGSYLGSYLTEVGGAWGGAAGGAVGGGLGGYMSGGNKGALYGAVGGGLGGYAGGSWGETSNWAGVGGAVGGGLGGYAGSGSWQGAVGAGLGAGLGASWGYARGAASIPNRPGTEIQMTRFEFANARLLSSEFAKMYLSGLVVSQVGQAMTYVGIYEFGMEPKSAMLMGYATMGALTGALESTYAANRYQFAKVTEGSLAAGWNASPLARGLAGGMVKGIVIAESQIIANDLIKDTSLYRHNPLIARQVASLLGSAAGTVAFNTLATAAGMKLEMYTGKMNKDGTPVYSSPDTYAGMLKDTWHNMGPALAGSAVGLGVQYALGQKSYSKVLGDTIGGVVTGSLSSKEPKWPEIIEKSVMSGALSYATSELGGKFDPSTGRNKWGLTEFQMAGINWMGSAALSSAIYTARQTQDITGMVVGEKFGALGEHYATWGGTSPFFTKGAGGWRETQHLEKLAEFAGISSFNINAEQAMKRAGYTSWDKFVADGRVSSIMPSFANSLVRYTAATLHYAAANSLSQTISDWRKDRLFTIDPYDRQRLAYGQRIKAKPDEKGSDAFNKYVASGQPPLIPEDKDFVIDKAKGGFFLDYGSGRLWLMPGADWTIQKRKETKQLNRSSEGGMWGREPEDSTRKIEINITTPASSETKIRRIQNLDSQNVEGSATPKLPGAYSGYSRMFANTSLEKVVAARGAFASTQDETGTTTPPKAIESAVALFGGVTGVLESSGQEKSVLNISTYPGAIYFGLGEEGFDFYPLDRPNFVLTRQNNLSDNGSSAVTYAYFADRNMPSIIRTNDKLIAAEIMRLDENYSNGRSAYAGLSVKNINRDITKRPFEKFNEGSIWANLGDGKVYSANIFEGYCGFYQNKNDNQLVFLSVADGESSQQIDSDTLLKKPDPEAQERVAQIKEIFAKWGVSQDEANEFIALGTVARLAPLGEGQTLFSADRTKNIEVIKEQEII
ncbi:MAG: cysteine peptidase family C39 domain-containing protein, partial [Candidatus Omnitrophota bacterium]|nr:cysteine peptidase family C39 domain-containing protein [Candidatus Omnitrophota bacterium]